MKSLYLPVFALLLALPLLASAGEGDPAAGKMKSAACAACHGQDGNSSSGVNPNLAGQHEEYLYKQLANFKSGARENATMAGMVAALSEQDMRDLAAFYASQSVAPGSADEQMVSRGETIYRGGNFSAGIAACIACHGPAGDGNPAANFPGLAAQHPEYTVTQLKAFRSGARANDAGKMMRNIAVRMTDSEMEAVAQYIAGLHAAE